MSYNNKRKFIVAGIKNLITKNYKLPSDCIDVEGLTDSELTFSENWNLIKPIVLQMSRGNTPSIELGFLWEDHVERERQKARDDVLAEVKAICKYHVKEYKKERTKQVKEGKTAGSHEIRYLNNKISAIQDVEYNIQNSEKLKSGSEGGRE